MCVKSAPIWRLPKERTGRSERDGDDISGGRQLLWLEMADAVDADVEGLWRKAAASACKLTRSTPAL